jgi:hypothetical protein
MQDVARKTGDTRERILDAAESSVLAKGFAGTSIDELIAAVGITKSGFSITSRTRAISRRRSSAVTSSARTSCSTPCSGAPPS